MRDGVKNHESCYLRPWTHFRDSCVGPTAINQQKMQLTVIGGQRNRTPVRISSLSDGSAGEHADRRPLEPPCGHFHWHHIHPQSPSEPERDGID